MAPKDEFEGKNLDAAIEVACKALNLGKDQIKYDVISYGATGIFGIVGAKKARIRVKNGKNGEKVEAKKRCSNEKDGPQREGSRHGKKEQKKSLDIRENNAAEIPDEREKEETPFETASFQEDGEGPLSLEEKEAAAEKGKAILRRIVDAISEETTINTELEADSIRFDVQGGNSAVLIGKRGQTLEAIQYLVDKMVNQQGGKRVRIVVDVEGYWESRRSSLREMAIRMAGKSKKSGKPITLGQMNAHDRRIVHLTLKDDPQVKTQSRGEGFFRKLVIFPRKASSPKRQKQRE